MGRPRALGQALNAKKARPSQAGEAGGGRLWRYLMAGAWAINTSFRALPADDPK